MSFGGRFGGYPIHSQIESTENLLGQHLPKHLSAAKGCAWLNFWQNKSPTDYPRLPKLRQKHAYSKGRPSHTVPHAVRRRPFLL